MTLTRLTSTLALAVGAGVCLPAPAAAGDRNAALEYWMVITGLQGQDRPVLAGYEGDIASVGWTPRGGLLDRADWLEDTTDRLVRASEASKCDFGLDYDAGPEIALNHLPGLSRADVLLRVDARLQAMDGEREKAADRLAASLRLAAHLADDETLPSSSLASTCYFATDRLIRFLEDRGRLSPANAGPILDALDELDGSDPFGMVDALERTRDMVVEWGRAEVGEHEGSGALPESVVRWLAAHPGGDEALRQIETADGFLSFLDFYEVVLDQAIDLWKDPGGAAELARLERAVRFGSFGPVAKVAIPPLVSLRQQSDRAIGQIEQLRTLLDP